MHFVTAMDHLDSLGSSRLQEKSIDSFTEPPEKERHFNGLKSVEKCFLVIHGKMIRLQGQKGFCHKAVYNTDPDRHVVEDLSALNEIKAKPDEYYY